MFRFMCIINSPSTQPMGVDQAAVTLAEMPPQPPTTKKVATVQTCFHHTFQPLSLQTVGFNLLRNSIPALPSRQPSTVWSLLSIYYLITACFQHLRGGPQGLSLWNTWVSHVPRAGAGDSPLSRSAQRLPSSLWVPWVGRVQAWRLEAGPVSALLNFPHAKRSTVGSSQLSCYPCLTHALHTPYTRRVPFCKARGSSR